jgi:phosphoribosylformylglycinamidine synthase
MPHPERAMELLLGSDDGVKMLQGFLASWSNYFY